MSKPPCNCWGCRIKAVAVEAKSPADMTLMTGLIASNLAQIAYRIQADAWGSILTRLALEVLILRSVNESAHSADDGKPSINDQPAGTA